MLRKTYGVDNLSISTQVLLICAIIHHVSESGTEVGVVETTILEFQFEACINAQEQSVFPSYNNRYREYNKQQY